MANILYLEWNSYAGRFITRAWKKNNDTYVTLPIDIKDNTRYGEKLTKDIALAIMNSKTKIDYVFSFNYFPVAAMAAKACRVSYVSYVYDNPYSLIYSETVKFDTNHIFLFDSNEVQKLRAMGISTVNYLPLASDTDYYDSLTKLTINQSKKYTADISFVGALYIEEKQQLYKRLNNLDEYTKGFLDGVLELQKKLYGINILEEMITPELLKKLESVAPLMEHPDAFASKEWIYANYYFYREITARERIEILEALKDYDIKIFTSDEAGNILKNGPYSEHKEKINGRVDYYTKAPYVYKNSKINLNITLKSIATGIPLRVFDIMANGGFVLTNYQEDLMSIFEPGEDLIYYSDLQDLKSKIDYYLTHEDEREKIAQNGYNKIKAYHNFYNRLSEFIF